MEADEEMLKELKKLTYEQVQEITRKLTALSIMNIEEIKKISKESNDYPSIFMHYLYMMASDSGMSPVILIGMLEKLKFDLMVDTESSAKKMSSKLFEELIQKSERKDGMNPSEGKEVG